MGNTRRKPNGISLRRLPLFLRWLGILTIWLGAAVIFAWYVVQKRYSLADRLAGGKLAEDVQCCNCHDRLLPINGKPHNMSIPIYYVNLQRSIQRRLHIERTFGSWGRLVRVTAVEGANHTELLEHMHIGDMGLEDWFKRYRPEMVVIASQAKAVRQAFDAGEEHMLLIEDDVSDILHPLWTFSLKEVVRMADDLDPNWEIINLQTFWDTADRFKFWNSEPHFSPVNYSKGYPAAAGATLLSRKGMKSSLSLLVNPEDGKVDCHRIHMLYPHLPCAVDHILWSASIFQSYYVTPPMFAQMYNEGSTGHRVGSGVDSAVNDHGAYHKWNYWAGVLSNYEAFEKQNAEE